MSEPVAGGAGEQERAAVGRARGGELQVGSRGELLAAVQASVSRVHGTSASSSGSGASGAENGTSSIGGGRQTTVRGRGRGRTRERGRR
jgi:hypothetical protein